MDYQPSSRQLSERVEVGFHRRPNRMRRRMWMISVAACLVAFVWLMAVSVKEDYRVYEAGDVATAHKSFENDCAQCHTSWAPLERLVLLDSSIHSTSNEKCIRCHDGLSHYRNSDGSSVTGNTAMSCAACHREHQGDEGLAVVADRHCVTCHSDLKNEKQYTGTVVARIESFDPHRSGSAHPEFALFRINRGDSGQDAPGEKHAVYALLGVEGKPVDQAVIRFNHERHLYAVYENGVLVEGLLDENRRLTDFSNRCDRCHELDAERRTMKPVNYEQHCSSCHPLDYDQRGNVNRAAGSGAGKSVTTHKFSLAGHHCHLREFTMHIQCDKIPCHAGVSSIWNIRNRSHTNPNSTTSKGPGFLYLHGWNRRATPNRGRRRTSDPATRRHKRRTCDHRHTLVLCYS